MPSSAARVTIGNIDGNISSAGFTMARVDVRVVATKRGGTNPLRDELRQIEADP